ncbi:MAG: hypothetical protein ACYSW7_11530 [Planctomycetota bacterium]|jgi:hypothetical protein
MFEKKRQNLRERITKRQNFMYPKHAIVDGVEFSYDVKLHPILKTPVEIRVKTVGMPGPCRARWEPTSGGWDTSEIAIAGPGSGQTILELCLK